MVETTVSLERAGQIIDKYQANPNMLIQIMLELQREYHWLPREVLLTINEKLGVPLTRIYQIATFYKAFRLTPKGRHEVFVCQGTACHVRGGKRVMEKAKSILGVKEGETTPDMRFTLERVNCLGCCALGPTVKIDTDFHGKMTPAKAKEVLENYD